MNLSKHSDFFSPEKHLHHPIHIIGCGAIGSVLAENLTRLGITNLNLYDLDIVEEHNIANQLYTPKNIYDSKVEALAEILTTINPDATPLLYPKGWTENTVLDGHVFLCVDSISLRKKIVDLNITNPTVKSFFDFRMRLTDAQHYAAINTPSEVKKLLKTMNFTDEDAKKETPVSACNTALSITPTIRIIVAYGVSNFLNYLKAPETLKNVILIDAFSHVLDVF